MWRMDSRWALVALLLALVGAQRVVFEEVSRRKGLRGRAWMSTERPYYNRYWGSCVFDANGDGYYDLLLPNHQDNTEFYLGSASGFRYRETRTNKNDVHGVAAYDWDGDGDEDFIITRGGADGKNPTKPKLFNMNGQAGAFSQISNTTRIGINDEIRGRSLAFFDVDGDGDRDLLMVNRHIPGREKSHFIYENVGGRFVKRTTPGFEESVAAWFCLVDVDKNGFLDVILMDFGKIELWMGNGSFRYSKQSWRLNGYEGMNGVYGCAEMDVDNDGELEIYMPRGSPDNNYDDAFFRIVNGLFVDISRQWRIPIGGKHSHVTYMDVDNDGLMDAYVSVMTYQKAPRSRDILLMNKGGRFERSRLRSTGLDLPYYAFEDGDNAVAFDYNNDGKTDLLVGARNAPWRLYENKTPRDGNNWVKIAVGRPRMGRFQRSWNKDPWGALVQITCRRRSFTQRTGTPGMSHSASNILRLNFGLGQCSEVTSIRVSYIGGVQTIRWGGAVNREIETGLLNCPGRNCPNRVRPCARSCTSELCERQQMAGMTMFCPA